MTDHYELIPEDKNKASQILSRALSGGVNLGRLRETKKGGKGAANYWIVSKEKRKIVLEKWKKDKRTVEQKDSPGVVEGSKEFLEIKVTHPFSTKYYIVLYKFNNDIQYFSYLRAFNFKNFSSLFSHIKNKLRQSKLYLGDF